MVQISSTPIPESPGTYVLVLEASRRRRIRIGALGTLQVEPGFYAYIGSAFGPGGLAARLAHHRRRSRSPHWHIDYLRRHTAFREAWHAADAVDWEHRWARALETGCSATIPLERFGASDCRCRSHLFHFARPPRISEFTERLGSPEREEA
jgi:Uri superfamily endonuclease